ncbi:RNA-binding protein [Ancylobacter sp. VNQ12]|uniref:RNA-binding protein n=1 Tax=Ancylobacter sp. VNQ12 TaxID=3400920 RepID=UPI003C054A2C
MQGETASRDGEGADPSVAEPSVAEETDAGLEAARRAVTRLCLASRTVKPVGELMRFVLAPDGQVVPDIAARLPGRGAWITARRDALAEAIKRKAFGRAFRGKGRVDPALIEQVETLLEKDALAALALANKAGRVVTGNMKVIEALNGEKVIVLVHAAEAAPDGAGKLDALARRIGEAAGREIVRVDAFPGVQLDLALGRANVVHAALLAHPTSAGFLARVRRLEGWRAD